MTFINEYPSPQRYAINLLQERGNEVSNQH